MVVSHLWTHLFFFPCVFYYLYLSPMYVEQGSMVYLCCEEALLVFVPMTIMYVSLCMHVLCVHACVSLYDVLLSNEQSQLKEQ